MSTEGFASKKQIVRGLTSFKTRQDMLYIKREVNKSSQVRYHYKEFVELYTKLRNMKLVEKPKHMVRKLLEPHAFEIYAMLDINFDGFINEDEIKEYLTIANEVKSKNETLRR